APRGTPRLRRRSGAPPPPRPPRRSSLPAPPAPPSAPRSRPPPAVLAQAILRALQLPRQLPHLRRRGGVGKVDLDLPGAFARQIDQRHLPSLHPRRLPGDQIHAVRRSLPLQSVGEAVFLPGRASRHRHDRRGLPPRWSFSWPPARRCRPARERTSCIQTRIPGAETPEAKVAAPHRSSNRTDYAAVPAALVPAASPRPPPPSGPRGG